MTRRQLLQTTALAATARSLPAAERLPVTKGILAPMLPKELSWADRFLLAKEVGFDEVECATCPDPREAEEIKKAADAAKLRIHSVMNSDHWKYPLSSPDPAIRKRSADGMRTSLDNAKLWGADTVLLVPAVVNNTTGYNQAWETSTREIKELVPYATERKVVIAIEEVWNKFLYSPREFVAYVDQFKSPYVKAYFDVGNCVIFGYPQDWIRTLGPRIAKIHLKDFKFGVNPEFKKRVADFVPLREGEIEWPKIHQALGEINYKGSLTVELDGGNKEYLQEVSRRVDLIVTGA